MPASLFEVQVSVEYTSSDLSVVVYATRKYIVSTRDLRYENNYVFIRIECLTIHNLYR